ncbi:MAG TPA: hypothetical protein VM681_01895 [Candidatus Thermoplasmatota archaeon]|nr:hypothetical protein [Candidatus Thermoplasmatota archaeon]
MQRNLVTLMFVGLFLGTLAPAEGTGAPVPPFVKILQPTANEQVAGAMWVVVRAGHDSGTIARLDLRVDAGGPGYQEHDITRERCGDRRVSPLGADPDDYCYLVMLPGYRMAYTRVDVVAVSSDGLSAHDAVQARVVYPLSLWHKLHTWCGEGSVVCL